MKVLIVVALVSVGCVMWIAPTPDPVVPNDTAKCKAACENLSRLGCPEGQPLPDGTPCVKFCEDTQKNGHALNPTCMAKVKACSEVDSTCHQ